MRHRAKPGPSDEARKRAEQEAMLAATEKMTPLMKKFAEHLGDLPVDEFAARITAALTLRPR